MNRKQSLPTSIYRRSSWIGLTAFLVANAFAAGVAVFKEQNFYGDESATPIAYVQIVNQGGPFIKLVTGKDVQTIDTKKFVARVDVLTAMPEEIGTEEQMAPIRRSLAEITTFANRFPKSAPLLQQQITALKGHVANFDDRKRRYNGEWISNEDYTVIEANNQKELAENRQKKLEKSEQNRIRWQKEDLFAAEQRAKGLEKYGEKWLPVAEASELLKRDVESAAASAAATAAEAPKKQEVAIPVPNTAVVGNSAVVIYARTVAMSRKEDSSTFCWVGGSPMEEEILYEHTKKIFRHRVIAVGVTNKGGTSDFILEVFWLGHPLNKANRTCINAQASKKISIPPGQTMTFEVASNYDFVDSTLVYLKRESLGSDYWNGFYMRTWSGYGYAGWVTRVSDGRGKTLGVVGARPPMIEFVREFEPPKFEK